MSQFLFSSFSIDSGSNLLIKAIADNINIQGLSGVLDIGCGTGVLGIALKKINENISLYALDRDSIAVNFTEYNLKVNDLNNNHVEGGLAFPETGSILFDLIVSNLPAKAGLPVLEYIITNAPEYLKHRGS